MPARAGIVHRLDKDTSGLLIAAKDAEAQAYLAAQFKDRTAHKEYIAVTRGIPKPASGRIENRLGRDPRDRKRFAELGEGGGSRSPTIASSSPMETTASSSSSPGRAGPTSSVSIWPASGLPSSETLYMEGKTGIFPRRPSCSTP